MRSKLFTRSTRSSLSIQRTSSSFLVRVTLESSFHTCHGRSIRIIFRLNSKKS